MKLRKPLAMGLAVAIFVFRNHALLPAADGSEKWMVSGGWTATDNMEYPRYDHTATLLENGNVLIVGMYSNTSELYDPNTDSFIPTGNTVYGHSQGFTATLLNNGKVLITGGTNGPRCAEIYDSQTGLFTATDSLLVEHCHHSATLLPDGRVLIAGGYYHVPAGHQSHAVAEIYDPGSGTFTLADSLNEDRMSHTATLLLDGRVLICGGDQTTIPGSGNAIKSCELYDPVTGTFTITASMEQPRHAHTLTLLQNGKVLAGAGRGGTITYSELFDPVSESWTRTGDILVPYRGSHTATLLPRDRVLLAGGYISSGVLSSAEIYNPETNTFSPVDNMITPRQQYTATRLFDGRILVAGGYNENYAVDLAELFWVDSLTFVSHDDNRTDSNTLEVFSLSPNHPNPFNLMTAMSYTVNIQGKVKIVVYNSRGELIKILTDAEHAAGEYRIAWDGRSENGSPIDSGVYLVRMEAGRWVGCRKIILLK